MNSLYIAANIFKRVFGSPKGWFSYLILPTLIVSLIVGFSKEPDHSIKIGYTNQDQGRLGQYLLHELAQSGNYQFIQLKEEALIEKIKSRELSVGFVIPEAFTDHLLSSQLIQVKQYYLAVSETSFLLEQELNQNIAQLERTVSMVHSLSSDKQEQELLLMIEEILKQQESKQVDSTVTALNPYANGNLFLIIGFILFFIMGSIFQSLGIILEDRKNRTMGRIFSAPVSSFEISLGNFIGSFGLGVLQILVILLITRFVINFDYGVEIQLLFIILSFFLLATVGIGTAVAGLVRNSSNMGPLNALVVTPTCMIGGCWWPLSIMPDFMQKLANFMPQKWAIDGVLRLANGQGLLDISVNLGILILIAVILLGFGAFILRPSEQGV